MKSKVWVLIFSVLFLVLSGCGRTHSIDATCNSIDPYTFRENIQKLDKVRWSDFENLEEVEFYIDSKSILKLITSTQTGSLVESHLSAIVCDNEILYVFLENTTYSMPLSQLDQAGISRAEDGEISRIAFQIQNDTMKRLPSDENVSAKSEVNDELALVLLARVRELLNIYIKELY